ncbi:MAG: SDR family oxidoreductase [Armatimonadetes bacterium]|nr:SDR family oxidoreductase [Armatimonadota bacterium]
MANANKVALVTGANKGLGLEIARQLAREGITVVIGARDTMKGEAAATTLKSEGLDAHFVPLDVLNEAHIAALPAYFADNFGRLDILVNNAGVNNAGVGGGKETTAQILRDVLEANTVAPFAITQALLPLLKESPAGRIVNHSSILGSITEVGNMSPEWLGEAYSSSKAALNMITAVQAKKLAGTNIKVNAAHPGWVKTDMGGDGAPLDVAEGAKTAVTLALLGDDGETGGFFHAGKRLPW